MKQTISPSFTAASAAAFFGLQHQLRTASPVLRIKYRHLWKRANTRIATRSCRNRKRACHYSPGVVRRSHVEALHVQIVASAAVDAAVAVAAAAAAAI